MGRWRYTDGINAYDAVKVRRLKFKYLAEGKGASVTVRFGEDGITICDPNRAGEGADKVFRRIYEKPV